MSVKALPAQNDNYDPPRDWKCMTPARHTCTGQVVGAVGAYPVCVNGADAEHASRERQAARREALLADPAVQAEMRREQVFERRYS